MSGNRFSGSILVAIVSAIVAAGAGSLVARGGSFPYLATAIGVGGLGLTFPFLGLCTLLVLFASLRETEGITLDEITAFTLLGATALRASLDLRTTRPMDEAVAPVVRVFGVLLGYLALALIVANGHRIGLPESLRDMAPLSCLLVLVIVLTTARSRKQIRLLRALLCISLVVAALPWLRGLTGLDVPLPSFTQQGAATLTPILLVVWGIAEQVERRRLRPTFIAMALIGLTIGILTDTRTIWLSMIITVPLLGLLLLRSTRRLNAVVLLFGSLALGAAGVLFVWRHSPSRQQILEAHEARIATFRSLDEDLSVQIRQAQLREAWDVFRESPMTGVGPGYLYQSYTAFDRYDAPREINHCDLANTLAKYGLIGTVLLYGLLAAIVAAALRLQSVGLTREDRAMGTVAAATFLIAVITGLSTPLLQMRGPVLVLAITGGLVLANLQLVGRERREQEDRTAEVAAEFSGLGEPVEAAKPS